MPKSGIFIQKNDFLMSNVWDCMSNERERQEESIFEYTCGDAMAYANLHYGEHLNYPELEEFSNRILIND